MKTITSNGTTQSGGSDNLSPLQRQLLSHFNSMNQVAQEFMVDLAEHNARVFPRNRPKLRLIAGGVQ